MNPNLAMLAKKMQPLKKEEREDFLKKIKNCAILFDSRNPTNIPECPFEERSKYKIDLIRSLYHRLEGKTYVTYSDRAYYSADSRRLSTMAKADTRQRAISNGICAYCTASNEDRSLFEVRVRTDKPTASLLRKKSTVLDVQLG